MCNWNFLLSVANFLFPFSSLTNENSDCESHFADHFEPMYESDEEASESILEPERNFEVEAEHEPNLPSINQSPVMQLQRKSVTVPDKPMNRNNYRLASENIPRNVLQMLNKFVTIAKGPSTGGSQELFVLKNKQNR